MPLRVVIADDEVLARQKLLQLLRDEPDIEVVGEVQQETELERAIEETRPDFLIVALERSNSLPAICQSILRNHPQLRVIAIASDRNSSMFYWTSLRIESNPIEASEAGVLSAIRGKLQTFNSNRVQ